MARRRGPRRDHERTSRVGELLREILAGELTLLDDAELENVSVTAVDVDRDLNRATVYFSTLDDDPETLDAAVAALEVRRGRLKRAVGDQARIRKVPELVFTPDPGVREGSRVEEILRELGLGGDDDPGDPGDPRDPRGGPTP